MSEDNMMNGTYEGRKIVLSSLVGSWASNLNTVTSDKDWKYFVAPTFDDLYTEKMFSTAKVSETLDYDVHDIRQLTNLLWKANLNFIVVLFGYKVSCVPELDWIFSEAEELATINLPYFYNSAMGMHYEKMKAVRELKATGNTQVLVDKFGYDTKQACHAMRCLYVLERFTITQDMRKALWFEEGGYRNDLIDIKSGKFSLENFEDMVKVWIYDNASNVKEFYHNCLPNETLKEKAESRIKEFIRSNI
jgi:uncharacterized protein